MSHLKTIGEFGFIDRISRGCLIRDQGVVRGIGDDAAAFLPVEKELVLVTKDLLVERVHFLRDVISGQDLGHKSLAVNLSDIAAMGGTAREAFVGIAVPESVPLDYLEEIYAGMKTLAQRYDVNILGGDTTGSKSDLVVSITVTGSVSEKQMLTRGGAKPGDRICVTGNIGDSRAGLHMLLEHIDSKAVGFPSLHSAHVRPEPRLDQGRLLAAAGGVTAAIDISDGISSDLGHIAKASGVGARVRADCLPISEELGRFCRTHGFDPVAFASAGGEDYELLFTVLPERLGKLLDVFHRQSNIPVTEIGEITDTGNIELIDAQGNTRPWMPEGWNHFNQG